MSSHAQYEWPTKEEAQLLRSSFGQLIPKSEAFCEGLYQRLFETAPSVIPLFPAAMEDQREKMVMMLATAIDLLDEPEQFQSACRECGARHQRYGAQLEQFDIVGELLMNAIDDSLEPTMGPEHKRAWQKFVKAVCAEMVTGFSHTDLASHQG